MIRLTLAFFFLTGLAVGQKSYPCPASPSQHVGQDFRKSQKLVHPNFASLDLTNARFDGVTLVGPNFSGATLTGANFTGAKFVLDPAYPNAAPDFTEALLQSACFANAEFETPTFFADAVLTCTDFSGSPVNPDNPTAPKSDGSNILLLGAGAPKFDRSQSAGDTCASGPIGRTALRGRKINCDLVSEWRYLNLADADLSGCFSTLPQSTDFSGAEMPGVTFDGAIFTSPNFTGADLNGATFRTVYMPGANFSKAHLSSTSFANANLPGATFYFAQLGGDQQAGFPDSASFYHAHLKNVNFAYATLSGADFTNADLYSDNPTATAGCKVVATPAGCNDAKAQQAYDGVTCSCATAFSAKVYNTRFTNAFLAGTDFSSIEAQSTIFDNSVLTGARFNAAQFGTAAQSGTQVSFKQAHLQGTALAGATLNQPIDLTDAFVDFTDASTNALYVSLDGGNHNVFACGTPACVPPTKQDVCVAVGYNAPTTVPPTNNVRCPNGVLGCAAPAPAGSNAPWASSIPDIGNPPSGVVPAWYTVNATFTNAPTDTTVICKGNSANAVSPW